MGQCGAWVLEELGHHFPPNILLCNGDGDGDDDGEEQKRGGGRIIECIHSSQKQMSSN